MTGCALCGVGPEDDCAQDCPSRLVGPERTATCPDPACPWELEVWGPEDELVVADHARQHAELAERQA